MANEDSTAPVVGRFFHHRIDRAQRTAVLRNVFLNSDPGWWRAFAVMMVLSSVVATFGLSQNSAATVIGAMIIAPLAAPIIGLGGSLAAGWPHQALRMLGVAAAAAAGAIAIVFALGLALPNVTPDAQVLARTSPDLRDLGVALAAGAAGAYAYTKSSLSSALVGVAIAVALVPPLGTIGLMLEEHRWTLAGGAMTLFTTNLVGITLSAALVLLATGFVPFPRLRSRSLGMMLGLSAATLAVAVVTVPLAIVYSKVMSTTGTQTDVYRQVGMTIGAGNTAAQVLKVDVNGNQVVIHVSDPGAAPPAAQFEIDLRDEIGADVQVTIK